MKQRKAIVWLVILFIVTPLLIFICFKGFELGYNQNQEEKGGNFFEGLPYISKSKHLKMLQDFSINNYHDSYFNYQNDDRISRIIVDKTYNISREVNLDEETGSFKYYLTNSTNILTLDFKDNILTKTIGKKIISQKENDKVFTETCVIIEDEYDYNLFLENTQIKGVIDFSNARIRKTKIDSKNSLISVEGIVKSDFIIWIPCLTNYYKLTNPTFRYYFDYSKDSFEDVKSLSVSFSSNDNLEFISEVIISLSRK